IASEIKNLIREGRALVEETEQARQSSIADFSGRYHTWYTRGLGLVRSMVPDRLDEFRRQYDRDQKRRTLDRSSYVIEDYLNRVSAPMSYDFEVGEEVALFSVRSVAMGKFSTQIEIVASCASRLDDFLTNIRGILQADL